jgi:hypothetical protein
MRAQKRFRQTCAQDEEGCDRNARHGKRAIAEYWGQISAHRCEQNSPSAVESVCGVHMPQQPMESGESSVLPIYGLYDLNIRK